MISRLLVANRGEIARRVIRTCRHLGISPAAVFSVTDARAPFVAEADVAVGLPGSTPAETYLRTDLLIDAARQLEADAVHPGYGFLSENADFARAVIAAGLTWVGPSPDAIEAMGSKIAAKKLMADAGVPVLPDLDPSTVDKSQLPVLVKASAGGGGRGMRVVRTLAELGPAVESAQREAESAFGDAAVFCEPYVETGRHIEVQILADTRGTVWALGERECSIQRRHQKIIEETPSPGVSGELRAKLCDAAVRAATAIGYTGAGTVEFLLSPSGEFHFLEVNTRLQVEHPVTECVYGVDLVELQLSIAEGHPLPARQPEPRGHAIEVRLYAEDPAADWLPQTGVLHRFSVPDVAAQFTVPGGYGVRLDSGVEDGSGVSAHYDPMLAKLIAWGPNRLATTRRLAAVLAGARIHGPQTNRDLLVRVLRHPAFAAGDTDTAFLARHGLPTLAAPLINPANRALAALAAALAGSARRRASAPVLAGLPSGWRNNRSQLQRTVFVAPDGERVDIGYALTRNGLTTDPPISELELAAATPDAVTFRQGSLLRRYTVHTVKDVSYVDSPDGSIALTEEPRFADPADRIEAGSLLAPMPGTVTRVLAADGDRVGAGQPLLVLEAMKMEHPVAAPHAGVLALRVSTGDQVEGGSVLAVIDPTED